MGFQVALK